MLVIQMIEQLVSEIKVDFEKFNNGNNAAGTRVRTKAQEIKKLMQTIREGVIEKRNSKK
jgi:hypothetical protein